MAPGNQRTNTPLTHILNPTQQPDATREKPQQRHRRSKSRAAHLRSGRPKTHFPTRRTALHTTSPEQQHPKQFCVLQNFPTSTSAKSMQNPQKRRTANQHPNRAQHVDSAHKSDRSKFQQLNCRTCHNTVFNLVAKLVCCLLGSN